MLPHKLHILIDDQKGFHSSFILVAKLNRITNYKMYTTSEEMLKELNGGESPLIFVDWNLIGSKRKKTDLIKHLRERKPKADIYVMSSSDDKSEQEQARISGANGWILKTNLINTLREFLNNKESHNQFKVWR